MNALSNLSKAECRTEIARILTHAACRANADLIAQYKRRIRAIEKEELATARIDYPPVGALLEHWLTHQKWMYSGVDDLGWLMVTKPGNPATRRRFRPCELGFRDWPYVEAW